MLGAQLRSKTKYSEETEQNVSFFMKEETRNYNTRYIRSLINDNGDIIADPDSILKEQEQFYVRLYSKQITNVNLNLFEEANIPKLSDKSIELCDEDISIEEIGKALKELPNKKTPGTDGFTADFYKFFWINIKDIVFESILYAFNNNTLSIEQKRGILAIIPKKGKDLRRLKNWRPLSLLNTDYKILTKLLASRLQKVISEIVSPDQSGYIRGRYIGENIRNIYDIIQYSTITNIPGMVIALDFEKAFDSISWNFLFHTLECFKFGENFIKWIKLLYAQPECCVSNNGYHSAFFKLGRGIRQGCPISALLFLLVVEIMACHIRNNQSVKGIPLVDGNSIVISQLADDTTLFLSDINSLQNCLDFITTFSETSGLKLNTDKSEAFWIGSKVYSQEKPCGLKWTNEYIKCLGIWCGPDIEGAINKNFVEKLAALRRFINMWSSRNLSIKGRIAVLRSLVLPQILYPASVLYVPDWVTEDVDSLFFKYIWPSKTHVKREVIIKEIRKGGLKMPLFSTFLKALKCTWVKRLVNRSDSRNLIIDQLVKYRNYNFHKICLSKLDARHIEIYSPFYQQVLLHWYTLFSREPNTVKQIINTRLWDNSLICIDNKPVHYKSWIENDIKVIGHIMDDKGNILRQHQLEQKYNCNIRCMDYNSLIHAIPRDWKNKIKSVDVESLIHADYCKKIFISGVARNLTTLSCKDFYWEFVSFIDSCPTAQAKWLKYLDVTELDWEEYYVIPYCVTRETFIQSFQYKIFHRYYPCNYNLSIWDKSHSPICSNCNEIDYLEHYFYKCEKVNPFWNMIIGWWRNILGSTINLSCIDVLFGIPNIADDKCIDFMNLCILYAKYYIQMKKSASEQIFFIDYVKYVKDRMEIEKAFCDINQLETFNDRWVTYYELL